MKNNLDRMLAEKPGWREAFQMMPISGNCDSGCGKLATVWFGNTSCATCGDKLCAMELQWKYDNQSTGDEYEEHW